MRNISGIFYIVTARALMLLLFLIVVACSDENLERNSNHDFVNVTIENIEPIHKGGNGVYRILMEDVLLEIPKEKHVLFRGKKPVIQPDIWVCWSVASEVLVTDRDQHCNESIGYLATLQFRAEPIPSDGYFKSLSDDFRTLPNYSNPSQYTLRPSKEFSDLDEFYMNELKTSFEYVLNLGYEDQVFERAGKERIHCIPGFRERMKSRDYVPNNGECTYGASLSPHVHMRVTFDSNVLPQISQFEKQVYLFVKSLIINKDDRN